MQRLLLFYKKIGDYCIMLLYTSLMLKHYGKKFETLEITEAFQDTWVFKDTKICV